MLVAIQSTNTLQDASLSTGSMQSTNIEDVGGSLSLDKPDEGFSQDLLSAVDNLNKLSNQVNAPISVQQLSPSDLMVRQQAVTQLSVTAQVGAKMVGQVLKGIDTLTKIQ